MHSIRVPHFMYLDIPHLDLLLLKGVSCLAFSVVECAVALLATVLNLLTHAVVFALLLAKLGVLTIPLLLQLRSIVAVEFAQFFVACREGFERVGELRDEGASELIVLGGARFQSAKLDSPCCHRCTTTMSVSSFGPEAAGVPFERAWCDGGCVANTQAALLLRLFLVVFLSQLAEFGGVFLFDCAPFSVELLDVVEPRDAARDLEPPPLAHEHIVLSTTFAEKIRRVVLEEGVGEVTYPGVDGLEAILRDIRISSCSRVHCG